MCNELTLSQKKKLRKILLAPIEVDTNFKNEENGFLFQWSDDSKTTIISGQKYISENSKNVSEDADMSNIAVAFYESLYGITMLNVKSDFENDEFAGDTMNTYKIVERYASSKKKDEWKFKYHCLANFWLLPFEVGRTNKPSGKLCKGRAIRPAETVKNFNMGTKDYMDRFLDQLSKNKGEYNKTFPEYFKRFTIGDLVNNDLSEFGKAHFLNDIYISNGNVIHFSTIVSDKPKLSSDDVDKVISCMEENIMERAKAIVNSSKARALYRTFKNLCDSIPEEMLKTE